MTKPRVLWYSNILLPEAATGVGRAMPKGSGWWMTALLNRIRVRDDLEIAVVSEGGRRNARFRVDGVEYFVLRTPLLRGLRNRLNSYRDVMALDSQLVKYADIVNDWKPDLVHVHGVESTFGLIKARGMVHTPMAVSIQGLMQPCAAKAYGELNPEQLRGSFGRSNFTRLQWKRFRARIPAERAILKAADVVIGRTEWDCAWASAYDPSVCYRHVDEILRPEFYEAACWSAERSVPHQLFCTTGPTALKGIHVLIEAVGIVRQSVPDVRLNLASGGFVPVATNEYARYVRKLITTLGVQTNITFLGHLEADGLVKQLQQASCYVTPSFVENSSNALQEAMLLGVPCIATASGGTPSIIDNQRTGLLFAPGDPALLALRILRVFKDREFAAKIGLGARQVSLERNDPARVEGQVLKVYRELAGAPGDIEARGILGHSIGG